jgi:hypothetical protein
MLLHRAVDRALTPLLAPMGFDHATEAYLTIARSDLAALAGEAGDPQAVIVGLGTGPTPTSTAALIAEPTLSSAVLSRIWRSDRNAGAALTQVEGEILRQFLARAVDAWHSAWRDEGIRALPTFSMAGSLALMQQQLDDERWHVARTVIREEGARDPLGVLLFCYPSGAAEMLEAEARSTMWRARIARGVTDAELSRLRSHLGGALRDLVITAPVTVRQHVTIGMLNALERGDIMEFDTDPTGAISLNVLDRELRGQLAASGNQLALEIAGSSRTPDHSAAPEAALGAADPYTYDAAPEHGDPYAAHAQPAMSGEAAEWSLAAS